MDLTPGQLVVSTAGRDKDTVFMVIDVEESLHGTYAYLSDGKFRKVHRPKRKNIKHLEATQLKDREIGIQLLEGAVVNNAAIRKAIAGLWVMYQENPETLEGGR